MVLGMTAVCPRVGDCWPERPYRCVRDPSHAYTLTNLRPRAPAAHAQAYHSQDLMHKTTKAGNACSCSTIHCKLSAMETLP